MPCKGGNYGPELCRACGRAHGLPPMFGRHHSEETRMKISNSLKGRPLSEEHKIKISESLKGIHPSEESRKRMSDFHTRNPCSEETRRKISDARRRQKPPMLGKHPSEESRKRISDARKSSAKSQEQLRNIRRRRLSKPQKKLFEVIKFRYPKEEVVMEYYVKTPSAWFFIDVAIPNLLLGFEYDSEYYHQEKEKDMIRHRLIEAEGWTLTHYHNESEFFQIRGEG